MDDLQLWIEVLEKRAQKISPVELSTKPKTTSPGRVEKPGDISAAAAAKSQRLDPRMFPESQLQHYPIGMLLQLLQNEYSV